MRLKRFTLLGYSYTGLIQRSLLCFFVHIYREGCSLQAIARRSEVCAGHSQKYMYERQDRSQGTQNVAGTGKNLD